jgi:type II restriction/modification system DNA methylase subunit YeeA
MDTAKLKKFAQKARRYLISQVSTKLTIVLAENSAARRESAGAVKKLETAIESSGREQIVERVAYTWFNRFCALRFMDVNRYTRIGTVSPAEGQTQPEILAEAKMGHIDEEMVHEEIRQKVLGLLGGKITSPDPQGEAYRLLVVAACNFWNRSMPFLFEEIQDYSEILMPDDLLSESSILAETREAMSGDNAQDVEVIGWLYQFYISEKKDEVFDGLKKNKKITPENIPAATQLFTPHWIVRYLVENSLGRLWLLNRPNSKLAERMEYYIKPESAETDFLKISKPEELKICDPACGSGHMLTYAFDLLYSIYEEEGYEPGEIPEKILKNNLFGIEIDERAGALASFAVTMKALQYDKRFFRRIAAHGEKIEPNICVLRNVKFDERELADYMNFIGRDLFTTPLLNTLKQFEEADNFGSLIRPELTDVEEAGRLLETKKVAGELFLSSTHEKVLRVLEQAEYLAPRYQVVIANPPYMGGKGMNERLKSWLAVNYQSSKSNLFATFIERNIRLAEIRGLVGMITMEGWMFLSSFENLRSRVLTETTLISMLHLGPRAFDSIGGEVVSTTAFVLGAFCDPIMKGEYFRLIEGKSESDKKLAFRGSLGGFGSECRYQVSSSQLHQINGSPIAYWLSSHEREILELEKPLSQVSDARVGLQTSDNDRFLRFWFEVPRCHVCDDAESKVTASKSNAKWFPCNKGGEFRKWYGNHNHYVNWQQDGREIRALTEAGNSKRTYVRNEEYYFKESISWCDITTDSNSFRFYPNGFIHDAVGHSEFAGDTNWKLCLMAFCNGKFATKLARIVNPTIHFHIGYYHKLPYARRIWAENTASICRRLVDLARQDWDSFEMSWKFAELPVLQTVSRSCKIQPRFAELRRHWLDISLEMQRLEEENNRIFIEAYGLQDELTPEVPLNEITLTSNPHYRYGKDKTEEELEALLLADTMRELVSYAVGCMFGRYSLDKPGLILANQGETIEDYLKQIPTQTPRFNPDKDNVIPLLDGEWFPDDITERFKEFLRKAFGDEHYEENLEFIEKALNTKQRRNYSIRDYFLGEFFNDHVKRYKKRPIYWLFSSPKGTFNALIYMHRYRPDTVSIVLNDYLREFRAKLASHKNHLEAVSISGSASQSDKTKALKEIDKIQKMMTEMEEYERDVLYPLATKQIEIDLDDGVKINYVKFGSALKKIAGLESDEE